MNNRPIGIFDSGIGGLTVLQNLIKEIPNEEYIYIGDNKHCPYGEKTKEQLYEYSCSIIDYFMKEKVKLIVIACNTTSSNILPILIKKYGNVKIIGVIEATTRQLLGTEIKKPLVIATKATIESHIYKQKIKELSDDIMTAELMTPKLVPLIEMGNIEELKKELHLYLDPLEKEFDSIIIGCTHYAIISDLIKDIVRNKKIISSSSGIVNDANKYLTKYDLKGNQKKMQIYTTGDVQQFVSSSKVFFNYGNNIVEQLNLD